MRNMGIIFSASMKNNFTSKSIAIIWYGLTLLLAAGMAVRSLDNARDDDPVAGSDN